MKMTLEWHKKSLANQKAYREREMKICKDLMARLERDMEQDAFYEAQIAKAEAMGKDGFDEDKFMVKKEKP